MSSEMHVRELGRMAHELGAGGTSHGHTCSDLGIGLSIAGVAS